MQRGRAGFSMKERARANSTSFAAANEDDPGCDRPRRGSLRAQGFPDFFWMGRSSRLSRIHLRNAAARFAPGPSGTVVSAPGAAVLKTLKILFRGVEHGGMRVNDRRAASPSARDLPPRRLTGGDLAIRCSSVFAGVVKLVDTPDLGSGGASRGGSSPFARTRKQPRACDPRTNPGREDDAGYRNGQ